MLQLPGGFMRCGWLVVLLLNPLILLAGGESTDPYARMDSMLAFDHGAIDRQFFELLLAIGCAENVFGEQRPQARQQASDRQASGSRDVYVNISSAQEQQSWELLRSPQMRKYQKACLKQLHQAKRSAVLEPAKGSSLTMAVLVSIFFGIEAMLGWDSNYGKMAFYGSMLALVSPISAAAQSVWTFISPPKQIIDELEIRFAQDQCFIPRALWPAIKAQFSKFRQSPSEFTKASDFIRFALKFTIYYPLPPVRINETEVMPANKQGLWRKLKEETEAYFSKYEDMDPKELLAIKNAVTTFARQLLGEPQRPTYLYIYGPNSIGKTSFVNFLTHLFEKFLEHSVSANKLDIASPADLMGTSERPGAFLRALSQMCQDGKHGIIAEIGAPWINEKEYARAIGNVFAERLEHITTTYFGEGADGRGIKLVAPPILVIVTHTEEIAQAEIKNLFTAVRFPRPKPETLLRYAKEVFLKNDFVVASLQLEDGADVESIPSPISEEFIERLGSCVNFKQVEREIEVFTQEFLER